MNRALGTLFLSCSLIVFSVVFFACDDSKEGPKFPTETEVAGYWQLKSVKSNGASVAFGNYSNLLVEEFYRFSSDKSAQRVVENEYFSRGYGGTWKLTKDTLQITGSYGDNYKIQQVTPMELVLVPIFKSELQLSYTAIPESDFPETFFSATIDGELVTNTDPIIDVYGSSMQLSGGGPGAFFAIAVLTNIETGKTYIADETSLHPSALLIKNDVEYGYRKSGQVTVVKKTDRYIHITFDFVVADSDGNEKTAQNGIFRARIPKN